MSPRPLHCFSIDVEGFSEGGAESFPVPPGWVGGPAERFEIAINVDVVLGWLAEHGVRATFFTLGTVAESQPWIVRRIADAGHEVASHGYHHRRLNRMDGRAARDAIVRSRQILQDVSGQAVLGFRAPDFSIDGRSLHLLDVVREAGYRYDSSINPTTLHDVYGAAGAPRDPHRLASGLVEFPPATVRVLGLVITVLGGGYFRLAPLWLSRRVLTAAEAAGRSLMTYTHPYELGPTHPDVPGLSPLRRFRHYVNIDASRARFGALFREFRFGRALDVLRSRGLDVEGSPPPAPGRRTARDPTASPAAAGDARAAGEFELPGGTETLGSLFW
jgi:polysaccharide deacetylase family protein (PEP-CTERM system associated)